MFIDSIYIDSFKNLKNFNLKFPSSKVVDVKGDVKLRLSILIGENGTAKTTLFELITQAFIDSLESNYEINFVINKEQFRKTNNNLHEINVTLPNSIVISTYTPIDKLNLSEKVIKNSLVEIKKADLTSNNFRGIASRIFQKYISDISYDIHKILEYVGYGKKELYFEMSEHVRRVTIDRAIERMLRKYNTELIELIDYIQIDSIKHKVEEYSSQLENFRNDFVNKVDRNLSKLQEKRLRANNNIEYEKNIYDNLLLENIVIELTFIQEKLLVISRLAKHEFKSGRRRLINISDIDNIYPGGIWQLNKDLVFMSFFDINNLVTDIWIEQNFNNDIFPISSMSSGELSLLIRFLDLYEYVEDNSIVLIDEPETHLHPKWIREYIERIIDIIGEKRCHVIIATHSPLIVSDVTKECIIAFKKENNNISQIDLKEKTLGMNYEELLSEVFGLEDYKGTMIDNYIKKVEQLLRDAKIDEALEIYNQIGDSAKKYNLFKKIKDYMGEKMYKVEWTQALEDLINPYHDFVLETLEYVNQDPQFSVQSPTDIENLTNSLKLLSENDSSKEKFSKIALKTDLPKYICNLKYENRDLLNEYKTIVFKYFEFLNKDWRVASSYSKEIKDAFTYFYENLIHGKIFNKEFLNSDIDAIHEFRRKLALKKTCPYCDLHEMEFDSASVDHFIPKSKHPLLAIYPKNLVVACTACNDRIKKENLYLPIVHPYYTSPSDYFYFVYSHENKKITVNFKSTLTFKEKRKIANFFRLFNLNYRYNTYKNDLYDNLIEEIQKGVNKQFKRIENLSRDLIEEIILDEITDKEKEVIDRRGIEFLTKLKADLYSQIKKEELKRLVDYFAVKYGIEKIYRQPQMQS